jgi:DNA-binding CsgD family transcriptional regulator/tetratricopeptide (TPR) repeat protein
VARDPVFRTGLSPVMVGRAAELARLRELAATVADPAVVLITGEAGIGKTRLVAELVATLDPAVPVLAGQGSQGAPGRPFQLLLEAVEPVVEPWDAVPAALGDREEPLRLLLGPVAPRLAGHAEREYGQEELLRAAVALVRELAGGDPTVLVFEDLHWADAQSVALFGRLAVAADLPLLLVGTFRPEGVTRRHPTVELIAELERQRSVATIALERLDRAGVAELLAAVYRRPLPFRVAEALHQRTGGNPFFLEELVVTADALAEPARLAVAPLPWNLTEAVLRRLDDLTPEQRRVIDAAAILGRRVSFDLLATVTGSGEEELIGILRHLVAENLVVEEEPDVFAFRHALTREAITSRLLGRERRRLHEKALAALQEAADTDHAAIAWHAQGAGRYDEMVEAARAGAWSYLKEGATAEALRLAEQGLSEADRDLDLLAAASKAAWLVGLVQVAIEHGERWHQEAAADGQAEEEASALIHLARLYWEAGDHQREWWAVWAALRVAEPLGESRTLARAYALVAQAHMLADQDAEAVEWADRAIALAERLGHPDVRAGAMVNKGTALIDSPEGHEQGVALLEEAAAEAEAGGFGFTLNRALHNLLVHQVMVWPPARSRETLRRMQEMGERTGQASEAPGWALHASAIAMVEGDLDAALGAIRQARRSSPASMEGYVDRFWLDFHEAALLLELDEPDSAHAFLQRHEANARPLSDPGEPVYVAAIHVSLAARRGDLPAARAALHAAMAATAWKGWGWSRDAMVVPALTAALRAGLHPSEVRALLPAEQHAAGPDRSTPQRAAREHLEAALLEAEGEPAAAAELYLRAAGRPGVHRPAYLVAECRLGAARCLLAVGDEPGALAQAREADRLLERWPGWRRDEVRALLRRLGAGLRAGRAGPGALTPREREVAALLAEGLSNGEVARRLFISTKTASVHVSHILGKLGMASRAEVAAWAVRAGVARDPDPVARA